MSTTPLQGLRFLIVEDDINLLLILRSILVKRGAHVTSACNGQEAWETFQTERFDFVISDVQMPYMSGTELLAKIRERDFLKPDFVFITGQSQVSEEEAKQLGAAALLRKPFRISVLMAMLEEILLSKERIRTVA